MVQLYQTDFPYYLQPYGLWGWGVGGFGFYGPSRLFHSFWAESIVKWVENGRPREKPPDHPQTELCLSHMWLKLGSNPQHWGDERFRVLKISVLNRSATPHRFIPSTFLSLLFFQIMSLATDNIKQKLRSLNRIYCKTPKNSDTWKIAVIILKLEQFHFTAE